MFLHPDIFKNKFMPNKMEILLSGHAHPYNRI